MARRWVASRLRRKSQRSAAAGLSIGRRILFSGVVALIALVAMEASLQLAGLAARTFARRAPRMALSDDAITILCVGDSHTYGLPLPPQDSYPAQLEAVLNERFAPQRFQVVNLGIPGLNSAFVANRLERQIFQMRPQLVMVWVGINNVWNAVESDRWRDPGGWLGLRQALMRFKLFRLGSIAWYSRVGHQYDRGERGGWYEGELPPSGRLAKGLEMPDPAPGLYQDYRRMVDLAHALDTPILFVTYPMAGQQAISRAISNAASRLGVSVIDAALDMSRAKQDGHSYEALVDSRQGPHPSRLLYAYIVQSMVPEIAATLEAWGDLNLATPPPD